MSSFFDKIKHKAEKAAHAVEKTAQDAGKGIEDTAKLAIGKTEKLAHKAQDEGMDIGNEIKGLADKTKNEINSLKNSALGEIRAAERNAQSTVINVGMEVGASLEEAVTEQLPKIFATVLSDLSSEAIKPGLKGAAAMARNMGDEMDKLAKESPELVKAINTCGFKIKIKANVELILVYQNFYSRVREITAILDRAGNDGIAFRRRDLIGFVESLGPTNISLGAGAEVSLGFDLGASASLTAIPLKLFTRLADKGLKELGVPA